RFPGRSELPPSGGGATERCRCRARHCCTGNANRRFAPGQALQFRIAGMDVVRHYGAAPAKSEALVDGEIILSPGEQPCYLGYLEGILIKMGLEAGALILPHQSLADFQNRFGGRQRESGRDRVEQSPFAMEAPDQLARIAIG